jgi:plastocyanin
MPARRDMLGLGGLLLALPLLRGTAGAGEIAEIRMRSDPEGAHVAFDPIGLWVPAGARVRWVLEANVHTTTAYHPANDGHPLRIPEGALPWDSGYLVEPGAVFEVTLTEEGVYDYLCTPHEIAGMVGRIVVGRPGGPGARPPGDAVPPAARAAFPSIERIVAERIVAERIVRPMAMRAHAREGQRIAAIWNTVEASASR